MFKHEFLIDAEYESKHKNFMRITINNEPADAPTDNMTVREILEWRNIPDSGTAVAVNNRLVTRLLWDATQVHEGDDITLISAAFGG